MKLSILGVAAAALFAAGAAHAAGPISVSQGGAYGSSSAVPVLTFEAATPGQTLVTEGGLTLAGSGAGVLNANNDTGVFGGSVGGIAAKPAGDTSANYYAVLGSGSATLTGAPLTNAGSLSLFAGSIDSYNTVTFNYIGGSQSFSGADFASPASGNQGDLQNNHYLTFNFGGAAVTSVQFGSSQTNSFEFDDVSVSAAPEPGVWAMMFMGVGMAGGALRLSRRRQAGALTA